MLALQMIALIVAQWLPAVASEGTLPPGAIARLGSRQMRTPMGIRSLSFSPDSRWLLAMQSDLAQIWDIQGRLVHSLSSPLEHFRSYRFTTTGKLMLFGYSGEYKLRLCEMEPGKSNEVRTTDITKPRWKNAISVESSFSADGKRLAFAYSNTNTIYVVDTSNGKLLWQASCDGSISSPPIYSENGNWLFVVVVANVETHVYIYQLDTGKFIRLLKNDGKFSILLNPVLSQDGKRIALTVSVADPKVLVWNCDTGKIVQAYKAYRPIGFLPNSHDLMVAKENRIAVYDQTTQKSHREFEIDPAKDLILSPDGKWLANWVSNAIQIYNAQTGQKLPCSADPPDLPYKLRFTPDNRLIGELKEWNGWVHWNGKDSPSHLTRPQILGYTVERAISNDLSRAIYASKEKISLIDISTSKEILGFETGKINKKFAPVELSADGKIVLFPTKKELQIHTPGQGMKTIPMPNCEGRIQASALSQDVKWALVAYQNTGEGSSLEVVDLKAQKISYVMPFTGTINAVSISHDGRVFMALVSQDFNSVPEYHVIDRESKRVLWKSPFRWKFDFPADFTLAPDGRSVTLTEDGEICHYELCTSRLRSKFHHAGQILWMTQAYDGKTLATVSLTTGPVLLWDLLGDKAKSLRAPTEAEYASVLETLASENAVDAYQAARRLALAGDAAVPHLLRRVPPVPAPDLVRIDALIRELDSAQFPVRERATHDLVRLGEVTAAAVKRALTSESLEVRTRARRILDTYEDQGSLSNRLPIRTVEVLEWIGSPAAREALRKMAQGAPGVCLTREAEAQVLKHNIRK